MSETALEKKNPGPLRASTAGLLILPLIALAGVIVLFLATGGGLSLRSPVPVEHLSVERTILTPGSIQIVVRNGSPQDVTIAQASVNAAIWPLTGTPSPTIPRLGSATITIPYDWVEGEAYTVTLLTTNSIPIHVEIPVAVETARPTARTFLGFTLIGLYVGVIPVYLGLLWFPALRRLGRRAMTFLLAVTIGILIFLGLDALFEALEASAGVPGPFQGVGLIGIGAVATFLLLDAIGRRQSAIGRSDAERRLAVAFMIATGIGLHNFSEGLAIGQSAAGGEISLALALIIGFGLHNATEGFGIVAPLTGDKDRPSWGFLGALGVIGGGPTFVGTLVGQTWVSTPISIVFLALAAGSILFVVYELISICGRFASKEVVLAGILSGLILGFGTDFVLVATGA